jgi:hypothetical protein
MTTWGELLAGDVVRGADQRGWTVVGMAPGGTWAGSRRSTVHLALQLGERRVTTTRGVAEPVDLVARGEHREQAAACQALIESGFTVTVLEDRLDTHR